ncbi:MAG: hypothetical protein MI749_17235, partial [Desulfovibrionales bacterium]|nr:hypothetical protein [Desulfovibrionales bacterium]
MPIIDVWMQHPTQRFLSQPFFDSLKKWTSQTGLSEIPLELTVAAMEKADIATGLIAAWHGPQGELISNVEVAGFINQHPHRLAGLASANLYQPMNA